MKYIIIFMRFYIMTLTSTQDGLMDMMQVISKDIKAIAK